MQAPGGVRRDRVDRQQAAACGLAETEEDRGCLVLGLESDEYDGTRGLQVGVRDRVARRPVQHDLGGQELGLLGGVGTRTEVDVVGAEGDPRELGVGVGVLGGEPATGQHTDTTGGTRGSQAARGNRERLGPARRSQLACPSPPFVEVSRTSGWVSRSGWLA